MDLSNQIREQLNNPKLQAALDNAARGLNVFPVQENGKEPLVKFTECASSNPEQIKRWWAEWPDANHAIITDDLLVIDRDPGGEHSWNNLHMMGMPDTLMARTPRGGVHAFFKLPPGVKISGSKATKDKVFGDGIDVRSFHNYVVGAGSEVNGKTYEWINDLPIADAPAWMIEMCQTVKPKTERAGVRIVEEDEWTLAECERYVKGQAPEADEGQRDDTAVAVANMMYDFGAELPTCREWLQEWNATKARPPKPVEKIEAIAESAMRTRQNAIGCRHPMRPGFEAIEIAPRLGPVQSSAQFVADFVPPDYVVDELLQRGFFYTITGNTGSGKTAVAMLLAAHVSEGLPLLGMGVERGRVLYFAGENETDVRMRWIAMAEHMNFDVNIIDVYFIPGVFKIPELKKAITQAVNNLGGVTFLIVDTSAAYYGGDDENNNVQMGEHARMLRSLTKLHGQPCVLVLCHPTKSAGADQLLPRGGGAFLAECDGNLSCKSSPPISSVHTQGKFRGPDFEEMHFQIVGVHARGLRDSKHRPIPTVIARPLDDAGQANIRKTTRSAEDDMLVALKECPESSMTELAVHLGWLYSQGGPNKSRAQRILERLRVAKLVVVERDRYELTDKGKTVVRKLTGEEEPRHRRRKHRREAADTAENA